jgi:hypothetical protein
MATESKPLATETEHGLVFSIRDCVLIAIATGTKALTLKELRNELAQIHPGSIYYHFWGGLLQPRFEEQEFNNDFAAWARHGLHDTELAERLGAIDPTELEDLEDVRRELVEIIEQRLDESDRLQWLPANQPFEFIQSQIIVFDTHTRVEEPESLAELLPKFSVGTVFYHFIDARRRSTARLDDFSGWLTFFGGRYADLIRDLAEIDPYFGTLPELRQKLAATFARHFTRTTP